MRSGGEFRWLLRSAGGSTLFDIRAPGVTWDEWLHYAGMYDQASGRATFYLNGELAEEMNVSNEGMDPDQHVVWIGGAAR